MDKVDSLDAAFFARRSDEKKTRKKSSAGRRLFSDAVREAEESGLAEEELPARGGEDGRQLEELLDEVHSSGEELLESQSLQSIKRYRQAVRGFLDRVLARLTVLEERSSAAGVRNRKRFTQIRVIDRKLERLVEDLLASQHRQLDLLGRINEIVGLLVDLLS